MMMGWVVLGGNCDRTDCQPSARARNPIDKSTDLHHGRLDGSHDLVSRLELGEVSGALAKAGRFCTQSQMSA